MKKLVQVEEVEGDGFDALLGKQVLVYCMSYIYTGMLTETSKTCILLSDPAIVYDTGVHDAKTFADAQKLTHPVYIQVSSIESFSETDKK